MTTLPERAKEALEAAHVGTWVVDPDDRPGMEWNNHILDPEVGRICFMAHSGGKSPDSDQARADLVALTPDLARARGSLLADFW